jgi:hypothetical protein
MFWSMVVYLQSSYTELAFYAVYDCTGCKATDLPRLPIKGTAVLPTLSF